MRNEPKGKPKVYMTRLQESAFPTNLPLVEVIAKFWSEVKLLIPGGHIHVIDPYILDSGGENNATYAGNVAALLKPLVQGAKQITFVYQRQGDEVGKMLEANLLLLNPDVMIKYCKGTGMHARYIVSDRSRALRLEFSLNRIGKSFGTVSLVSDEEDLGGIVTELERLDPAALE
jgi:hypothetical protein